MITFADLLISKRKNDPQKWHMRKLWINRRRTFRTHVGAFARIQCGASGARIHRPSSSVYQQAKRVSQTTAFVQCDVFTVLLVAIWRAEVSIRCIVLIRTFSKECTLSRGLKYNSKTENSRANLRKFKFPSLEKIFTHSFRFFYQFIYNNL